MNSNATGAKRAAVRSVSSLDANKKESLQRTVKHLTDEQAVDPCSPNLDSEVAKRVCSMSSCNVTKFNFDDTSPHQDNNVFNIEIDEKRSHDSFGPVKSSSRETKKHNSKQKMTDHSDDIVKCGFLDSDLTRPPTKKTKSDDFEFHAPPGMTNNAFVLSGREMWEAFCCKQATEILRKMRVSVKITIDNEGSKMNKAKAREKMLCLLKDHGCCIDSTGTSSLSDILSSVVSCTNEKGGGATKETSIGPALGPKLGTVSKKNQQCVVQHLNQMGSHVL